MRATRLSRKMRYGTVAAVVILVFLWIVVTAALGHSQLALIGIGALGLVVCMLLLEARWATSKATQRADERDRRDGRRDEEVARLLQLGHRIRRRDLPDLGRRLDEVAADLGQTRQDLDGAARRLDDATAGVHRDVGANQRLLEEETKKAKQFRAHVRNQIRGLPRSLVQQIEAQQQLHERFRPTAPFRAAGGWALAPTVTLEIVDVIARTESRLVVECGSGLSTVWLAYAIREQGHGRLVALEHDEGYAAQTRTMLHLHELDDVAEVRNAPLGPVALGVDELSWYSARMDDLRDIGVLLVDGPPYSTGDDARYPALPLLRNQLAAGATIVLDDATRADERATLSRWLEEDSTLKLETELPGGAVLLRAA